MRVRTIEWRVLILGSALTAASTGFVQTAQSAPTSKKDQHVASGADKASLSKDGGQSDVHLGGGAKSFATHGAERLSFHGGRVGLGNGVYYHLAASHLGGSKSGKMRFATRGDEAEDDGYGGGLQCVPFARAASGIELKGNAAEWWYAAAGVYDRGEKPELGSVLNFRSTGHMRLGHVSVVTGIVGPREIEVDHANWAGAGAYKGGVERGVHVIDVSADNDWSEVRVALDSGGYGSVYPTYGFIYDRPDTGALMASKHAAPDTEDDPPTEVAEAAVAPHLLHVAAHHANSARARAYSHVTLHPMVKHISFGSD